MSWLEKLILSVDEIPEFRELKFPKRQWDWLLGRIAAKDAVRVWFAKQTGSEELLHPAALTICKNESGQPYVRPIPGLPHPPAITISHSQGQAVAIASSVVVGVDFETELNVSNEVLATLCSPAELLEIQRQTEVDADGAWPTRIWAAKEAASKALGIGLNHRPQSFQAIDWLPKGQFLIQHAVSGERLIVFTQLTDAGVLAHTSYPTPGTAQPDDRFDVACDSQPESQAIDPFVVL